MAQIKYNLGDLGTEVYSTEEIAISTWVDGKPIYRKVIDRGSYKGAGNESVANCNIDKIIRIDALTVDKPDGSGIQTTYTAVNGAGGRYAFYTPSDEIIVLCGSYYSRYIIIEYTKKTD